MSESVEVQTRAVFGGWQLRVTVKQTILLWVTGSVCLDEPILSDKHSSCQSEQSRVSEPAVHVSDRCNRPEGGSVSNRNFNLKTDVNLTQPKSWIQTFKALLYDCSYSSSPNLYWQLNVCKLLFSNLWPLLLRLWMTSTETQEVEKVVQSQGWSLVPPVHMLEEPLGETETYERMDESEPNSEALLPSRSDWFWGWTNL